MTNDSQYTQDNISWHELAKWDPTNPRASIRRVKSRYPSSCVEASIFRRENLAPDGSKELQEGYEALCYAAWAYSEWNYPINPNNFRQTLSKLIQGTPYIIGEDNHEFFIEWFYKPSLQEDWTSIYDAVNQAAQGLFRIYTEALSASLLNCDLAIAIAPAADDSIISGLATSLRRTVGDSGTVEVCYLSNLTILRATNGDPSDEGASLFKEVRGFLTRIPEPTCSRAIHQVAVRAAGRYFNFKPIEFMGIEFDLHKLLTDARAFASTLLGNESQSEVTPTGNPLLTKNN